MSMLGAMAWLARKVDSRSELMLASAFVTWNVLIPPVAESHYFGVLNISIGSANDNSTGHI